MLAFVVPLASSHKFKCLCNLSKSPYSPLHFFNFQKFITRSQIVGQTSPVYSLTQFSKLFRMIPHLSKSVQKQKTRYKSQHSNFQIQIPQRNFTNVFYRSQGVYMCTANLYIVNRSVYWL